MRTNRRVLPVVLLVMLLVASACGAADPQADVTTTTAQPDTTTTTAGGSSTDTTGEDPGTATVLGISCAENAYSGRLGDVCARGVLRVGFGQYAPTGIKMPDGSVKGVDVDVTRLFAEALGVEVEFFDSSFGLLPAGVQARRFDMTTSLVVSDLRKQVIDFSDTLYSVEQLFAVRADSPFETIEDLNDPAFRIASSEGSYGTTVIQTYIPNATLQLVEFENNTQQLAHVLSGRSDGMPIETPFTTARVMARYGDQIRLIPDPATSDALEGTPVAYGLPKGDTEFVQALNVLLASLREEGAIDGLFAIYIEETLDPIVVP